MGTRARLAPSASRVKKAPSHSEAWIGMPVARKAPTRATPNDCPTVREVLITPEALALRSRGTVPISSRSEEHTSELQSRPHLVCRLLLEKKKKKSNQLNHSPPQAK